MRILPHGLAAHRTLGALATLTLFSFAVACSDTGPTGPVELPNSGPLTVHPDLQGAVGSGSSTAILTKLTSNMCMDVTGSKTAPGTPVILWNCTGNANQQFTWQSNGQIRTIGGMCLDDFGGQGKDGDPITIWTCHGGPNQTWTATASGQIKGINGKCIDVYYSRTTPGTKLILWSCSGNPNQQWDASGSGSPTTPPDTGSTPTDPGTSEPPAGAVVLRPGASLQAAVDQHGEGTTFYLEAGTYRRQSVTPKTGDVFLGAPGAVLDGENAVTYAFSGGADRVRIQGLVIEHYTPPAQMGAVKAGGNSASDGTYGWVVADCEVRYNATAGIRLGDHMQVLRTKVHHNGQEGIVGIGDNILIEGNEIAFNNYQDQFNPGWEAGGTKFVATDGLVVRNNYVHDNHGPGLWTDINNINTLYEGNRVENNTMMGIFHEISYKATIRNNTVKGNGFALAGWLYGAGIMVSASRDVEIYGNTVSGNANGITAVQQNRGSGTYGPHLVQNLYVHDNTVTMASGHSGIAQDIGDRSIFTSWNNRFANNTYHLKGNSQPFAWMDQMIDQGEWRSYGQDDIGKSVRDPS